MNSLKIPQTKAKGISIPKQDTNFVVFAYGVVPSLLHHIKIKDSYLKKDSQHEGIIKLRCGSEHFIMLTEKNLLLVGGGNEFGQRGVIPDLIASKPKAVVKSQHTEEPVIEVIPQNLDVISLKLEGHELLDIAAGCYHSLILAKRKKDDAVKLFCMGHELGCGFLDKRHRSTPTELVLPVDPADKIVKIFAGQMRSAAVLESGRLFMWGEWFSGARQRHPVEITINLEDGDQIKKISIGKMHALIVTAQGFIFSIGDNTYGELGEERSIRGRNLPTLIPFFDHLRVIDCEVGCRHSIVLDIDGNVYSFGDNSEGQCGVEEGRVYTPKIVEIPEILGENQAKARFIYAGDSHSAIVTDNGDLYV